MAGITDLGRLIAEMQPQLQPGIFVFCTLDSAQALPDDMRIRGTFEEAEGRTVILDARQAERLDCPKSAPMRQITLRVHSSLGAVGLTAAIATELTRHGISANVVAAYYHDHIFVAAGDAERAIAALSDLGRRGQG